MPGFHQCINCLKVASFTNIRISARLPAIILNIIASVSSTGTGIAFTVVFVVLLLLLLVRLVVLITVFLILGDGRVLVEWLPQCMWGVRVYKPFNSFVHHYYYYYFLYY